MHAVAHVVYADGSTDRQKWHQTYRINITSALYVPAGSSSDQRKPTHAM